MFCRGFCPVESTGRNLAVLPKCLSDEQLAKLRILVHTHDTFKPKAKRGVAIRQPESHASLARAFLVEFCDDAGLLTMVQLHDEPYHFFSKHDELVVRTRHVWATFGRRLTIGTSLSLF